MLFTRKTQCQLIFLLILFTSINYSNNQLIKTADSSSDIEIIPQRVIINSTSITKFLCINHQLNEKQLNASLSKSIPKNQIKLSTKLLNKTAMIIQLEANNYVGIFHISCHLNGEQKKGNRADVIVKSAPGIIILAEPCRVYERQFIKCIIRAPIIAAAIQNGFPAKFQFDEITHPSKIRADLSRFEFLKDESTNENLVFKWKPTVAGQFPNGIRMRMKTMLRYFNESIYEFDMTSTFGIKPKFIIQALSRNEIQINLTNISTPAVCERSILPQITSNINRTWISIETERNSISINNLVSNSIHRVCIKCRQIYTNLEGEEICENIKTMSIFDVILKYKVQIIIISVILSSFIILIILGLLYIKRNKYYQSCNVNDTGNENSNRNAEHTRVYVSLNNVYPTLCLESPSPK